MRSGGAWVRILRGWWGFLLYAVTIARHKLKGHYPFNLPGACTMAIF
jgi:hypothetical protein